MAEDEKKELTEMYGGITDILPSSSTLWALLNNAKIHNGKEDVVNGKTYGPAVFSGDNFAVAYAGITIRRAVFPSDESAKKYGMRPVMPDWFSYNGLTADELRNACRLEGKEVEFFGPVRGRDLNENGTFESVFMLPCIMRK